MCGTQLLRPSLMLLKLTPQHDLKMQANLQDLARWNPPEYAAVE